MTVESSPTEQKLLERLTALTSAWNELSTMSTSVAVCRRAVELATESFGFSRIGIWLIHDDPLDIHGSFGVDECGQVRDERGVRLTIKPQSVLGRVLTGQADLQIDRDVSLHNHKGETVGRGTQAVVVMRDAERILGAVTADDLLDDAPLREHDVEVLRLYGSTLAHLLSRQRAIESEARIAAQYQAVVENAGDRICEVDREGKVLFINHVEPPMTVENVIGINVYEAAFEDQRDKLRANIEHVFETGEPSEFEIVAHGPHGERQWFVARAAAVKHGGEVHSVVLTASNIHQLKTAEQALRSHQSELESAVAKRTKDLTTANHALRISEERFRLLAENVPGVIYLCRNDSRYSMIYLNDEVEAITGYPKEDFLNDRVSFVDLYHPDDAAKVGQLVEAALARRDRFTLLYRIRRRDGDVRWIEEHGVGVYDGDRLIMLEGYLHDVTSRQEAVVELREAHAKLEQRVRARTAALTEANENLRREIAERRAAEAAIQHHKDQLRTLASQLMLAEERERRRIAADVHDQIGQSLSLTQIKLNALKNEQLSPRGQQALNQSLELVNHTVADARTLIFELSPPVLYDLGLVAAIEWLIDRYSNTSDLTIELEDHDCGPLRIDEAVSVLLYRGMRELLVNVIKYAEASHVRVTLDCPGAIVKLTISDDGKGIEPTVVDRAPDDTGGFGLFNLRQQLEQLGGALAVDESESGGASVTMIAPLMTGSKQTDGGLLDGHVHSAG